jgi:hypothetical protein
MTTFARAVADFRRRAFFPRLGSAADPVFGRSIRRGAPRPGHSASLREGEAAVRIAVASASPAPFGILPPRPFRLPLVRQAIRICTAGGAMPENVEPFGFACARCSCRGLQSGAGYRILPRVCRLRLRIPISSFPLPVMLGFLAFCTCRAAGPGTFTEGP